jgi:hypothetical protein
MNTRFRTSPAASSIASVVKVIPAVKLPIVGFFVNGPTLGENPVAVMSTEWIAPGGGGLGLLSMTMSPPSLQVGLQADDKELGNAVADTSRVMTPARALAPNPVAARVTAKIVARSIFFTDAPEGSPRSKRFARH